MIELLVVANIGSKNWGGSTSLNGSNDKKVRFDCKLERNSLVE